MAKCPAVVILLNICSQSVDLIIPHVAQSHYDIITLTCKEDRNCDLVATKPVTSILLAVGMTTKFTSDTSAEDPYSNGSENGSSITEQTVERAHSHYIGFIVP